MKQKNRVKTRKKEKKKDQVQKALNTRVEVSFSMGRREPLKNLEQEPENANISQIILKAMWKIHEGKKMRNCNYKYHLRNHRNDQSTRMLIINISMGLKRRDRYKLY